MVQVFRCIDWAKIPHANTNALKYKQLFMDVVAG